jgi:sulfite exporter TauE/SafE
MGVEDGATLSSRQPRQSRMTILPALTFGLLLGLRHATDADHIAAVGTMASSSREWWRTALVGAWWGVGHSASVLLVGGGLVLLRAPMPTRVALTLEFGVALMLIALGVLAVVRRRAPHQTSPVKPLLVGVMHGLAGSAVLALLVIGTTASALTAAAYLVCFCIGTIAGMAAMSVLFALPSRLSSEHASSLHAGARVAAGVASVAIGLALAHRVGVEEGLFAASLTQ